MVFLIRALWTCSLIVIVVSHCDLLHKPMFHFCHMDEFVLCKKEWYLQASFPLDSTFGGDMRGNFSSGFCPQCSHFAQRRDSYDDLLNKRVQTMHTILPAVDSETFREEERHIMRRKSVEGPLTISMTTHFHTGNVRRQDLKKKIR